MANGDGEPKFPKRFYTKGLEPFPLKSIHYYSSDAKLFPALAKALKTDEWDEISQSSLGVFLQFYELNFGWASRLVHFMLSFQIECKKKYELWSLVDVNPVRFSLNEFENITGLNCEYVDDMEAEIELTEAMKDFWGQLGVPVDSGPSIEQLTTACEHAGSWSREDRIRLGYLAIYAGFIEARKPSVPTRLYLSRMVMDLDAFLEYPWGRLAFKNLIESVKDADLAKSYTLSGFVEALQVWVYISLPELGDSIGDPIYAGRGRPSPPLLAYRGCRGRRNVKEIMLRQTRFNNLNVKDRDEMFPTWDDDTDDPAIDSLVGAFYGDFGTGPWKWRRENWDDKGIKISNIDVVVEVSKKKRRRPDVASESEDGTVSEVDKKLFLKCFEEMSLEMSAGFRRCDDNFKNLSAKVEAIELAVSQLKSRKNLPESGTEEQVKSNQGETRDTKEQEKENDQESEQGEAKAQETEQDPEKKEKEEEPPKRVSFEPSPKKTYRRSKRGKKSK